MRFKFRKTTADFAKSILQYVTCQLYNNRSETVTLMLIAN